MSPVLLNTKLYPPRFRPDLVNRSRLMDSLQSGAWCPFTLVSAPAGFGKTTLVNQWISQNEWPVGWISLDEKDNDLGQFLSYFVACLRKVAPQIEDAFIPILEESSSPIEDGVLANLINWLGEIDRDFIVVLDDYHVIDTRSIHEAVSYLLDNIPPNMHLIMTTRADPPFQLSRLRVRGGMNEIRATDLRFSRQEIATFMAGSVNPNFSSSDVETLEIRTEGWIAALQLAAISMRGRSSVTEFVQDFAGDDRYIVDYLLEEVLRNQSEEVRDFLIKTSVLYRFCAPLCDAVTEQSGSRAVLESLDQANLFLISLDERRQWYRYHQLFSDMLRSYLVSEQSEAVSELYSRASEWHEKNGLMEDAVDYALLSEDFDRAATLIELIDRPLFMGRQEAKLLDWLNRLPIEIVMSHPELSLSYVWGQLLRGGESEQLDDLIGDLEHRLNVAEETGSIPGPSSDSMPILDENYLANLRGALATLWSYLARSKRDLEGTIQYSLQAIKHISDRDLPYRCIIYLNLGRAYLLGGRLDESCQAFLQAIEDGKASGYTNVAIYSMAFLARIKTFQGKLREAFDICQEALRLAQDASGSSLRSSASIHIELIHLFREWNDLDAMSKHIEKASDFVRQGVIRANQCQYHIVLAQSKAATNDYEGAVKAIARAEELEVEDSVSAQVLPAYTYKVRYLSYLSNLPQVTQLIMEKSIGISDELSYQKESEHIALVRVLIAQHHRGQSATALAEAIELLQRLQHESEVGGRYGVLIEVFVLQALALSENGQENEALTALEKAVSLGETESYVRVFLDEGEPMRILLTKAISRKTGHDYANVLLSSFGAVTSDSSPSDKPDVSPLAEPLTERETEVLRSIVSGKTNQQIADDLFISIATVKRHVTNIYGKLEVRSRTQALAKAAELNLL